MASFEYIARNAAGEEVAGLMEADSEAAVVRSLDERKLYTIRVTEQVRRERRLARSRVRLRDLGAMYGQLADLLRAGVPLLKSLEIIARSSSDRRLGELVTAVQRDVAEGKSMAESMAAHPEVFNSLHSAMVKAGERGGFVEDVLANLADFLERQDELRSKVRGAMVYPAVLVAMGLVIVVVLMVWMVPKVRPLFGSLPSLPLPTVILCAISDLIRDNTLLLAGLVVMAVLGVRVLLRSKWGRSAFERGRLRVPVLGKLLKTVSVTRFCRILGTMLANGVPILQALAISKDATGCDVLAESIEKATENVRAGEPLAAPLKTSGFFPPQIIEMIAVAEESNQLEKVLVEIANTVERRTNRQVDNAVRLVEPLILVLIGGMVAFVAMGLLFPMFSLSEAIK